MSGANQTGATRTQEERAMEYYANAIEFIEAYDVISAAHAQTHTKRKDLELPNAKLWLLCHALEVTLKGWLVLKENAPLRSERSGAPGVRPLKGRDGYGHDLDALAAAVAAYYPAIQPWINGIRHLNQSYWGAGARDYEFPEGNRLRHHLSPLDGFADFIRACRNELGLAIQAQNGGRFPNLR